MPDKSVILALLTSPHAKRIAMAAGWLLAAAIVVMTLGPLEDRPQLGNAQVERFAAYLVLALVFAVAYPRRPGFVALGLVAAVAVLEVGQGLAPHRDPRFVDAVVKAAGALAGVAVAQVVLWSARRSA